MSEPNKLNSSKLLSWSDGRCVNLEEWQSVNLPQYIKTSNKAAPFASIIIDRKISPEWTEPLPVEMMTIPENANKIEKEVILNKAKNYLLKQEQYKDILPFICAKIQESMTEQSLNRVRSVYMSNYDEAVARNDVLSMMTFIEKAHRIEGKTTTLKDGNLMRFEMASFELKYNETLSDFKIRYDNLLKRAKAIEVNDYNTEPQRCYQFLYRICHYQVASVSLRAQQMIALQNKAEFPTLETAYEELLQLEAAAPQKRNGNMGIGGKPSTLTIKIDGHNYTVNQDKEGHYAMSVKSKRTLDQKIKNGEHNSKRQKAGDRPITKKVVKKIMDRKNINAKEAWQEIVCKECTDQKRPTARGHHIKRECPHTDSYTENGHRSDSKRKVSYQTVNTIKHGACESDSDKDDNDSSTLDKVKAMVSSLKQSSK
jgi:hypothetical protein